MKTPEQILAAVKELCKDGETQADHERHREKLEAAYAAFAGRGPGLPAQGETALTAHIAVTSEDS